MSQRRWWIEDGESRKDLREVTCSAAAELDNAILGQVSSFANVALVRDYLKKLVSNFEKANLLQDNYDPDELQLLRMVGVKIFPNDATSHRFDVNESLQQVIRSAMAGNTDINGDLWREFLSPMEKISTELPEKTVLAKLRDFCLTLNDVVTGYLKPHILCHCVGA